MAFRFNRPVCNLNQKQIVLPTIYNDIALFGCSAKFFVCDPDHLFIGNDLNELINHCWPVHEGMCSKHTIC